jgi:hypothetical protein
VSSTTAGLEKAGSTVASRADPEEARFTVASTPVGSGEAGSAVTFSKPRSFSKIRIFLSLIQFYFIQNLSHLAKIRT